MPSKKLHVNPAKLINGLFVKMFCRREYPSSYAWTIIKYSVSFARNHCLPLPKLLQSRRGSACFVKCAGS